MRSKPDNTDHPTDKVKVIEIINISKSFGKQEVLHNISFSLKKGEITAFLGANGAGKTTTMNIMTGVLSPDRGKVMVNGSSLSTDTVQIKKTIGYLPENNPLYGDMYVREYLEYAGSIYSKKEVKSKVDEMIERVDLKDEYKKKIHTLSQGNKQRVGLAQALIHDPEILILDEPANGLDPGQQFRINNLIRELGQSKILLFSSHRLDDVADIASRCLLLKAGSLILDESVANIESIKEYFYK